MVKGLHVALNCYRVLCILPNRRNVSFSLEENFREEMVKIELKQRRRRQQRERQKSNRFRLAKQQLCTCITLICTFLCRCCKTTTWKCLNSRFVEDGNTGQPPSFSFPELWYSPLEFNSKRNCQRLTNQTRWNKRDKFEAARIHSLGDVFVFVFAVVVV